MIYILRRFSIFCNILLSSIILHLQFVGVKIYFSILYIKLSTLFNLQNLPLTYTKYIKSYQIETLSTSNMAHFQMDFWPKTIGFRLEIHHRATKSNELLGLLSIRHIL